MFAMLIKPLPTYLDMPVLKLDNIALSGETLATIAEAETAIALIRLRGLTRRTWSGASRNSCLGCSTRRTVFAVRRSRCSRAGQDYAMTSRHGAG
jgi:hypothetical protein